MSNKQGIIFDDGVLYRHGEKGRWIVQNKQSISQPSFFPTNVMDGEVYVEFDN